MLSGFNMTIASVSSCVVLRKMALSRDDFSHPAS